MDPDHIAVGGGVDRCLESTPDSGTAIYVTTLPIFTAGRTGVANDPFPEIQAALGPPGCAVGDDPDGSPRHIVPYAYDGNHRQAAVESTSLSARARTP